MVTYTCELCGFSSIYSTRYRDHCMTRKHLRNLERIEKEKTMVCDSQMTPNDSQMTPNDSQMTPNDSQIFSKVEKEYICEYCNKKMSKNSNLHRHYSKCKVKKKYDDDTYRIKAENEKLKEEVNKLKSQQSNTTNNINITNYIKNDKVLNYLNSNHGDVIEMDSFINKLKNDTLLSRDMMECFITCYNHGGVDSFGTTLVKYLNQICKQLDINIFPLCCSDSNLRSHKEKNEVGWETVIDTKKIEEIINEIVTDIFMETDTMIPLDSRERKKICNIVKKSYDMSSLKIMEDFSDNSDVYNPLE
jgi:cell division protein FtsB